MARRDPAAAGGGERRRPCAVREEAGLGVESKEQREEKLSPRGISEGLTEGGVPRQRRSSGAAVMEDGEGLGFERGT